MSKEKWTTNDMPSMKGKTALVTGANSGLGFYTTKALAGKGAKVIMACRNSKKAEHTRTLIRSDIPEADLELKTIDMADLISIEKFANEICSSYDHLDLLINNAGLMALPFAKTKDGFEMQFGVNHLGHFALTGRLLDLLLKIPGSRIINVSSLAHTFGKMRFDDLNWEKGYKKWGAYGQSKLANLLFTSELKQRLNGNSQQVLVAVAHPGYANTELHTKGAKMKGDRLGAGLFQFANNLVAQSAEKGALPTLYAATADDVVSGSFYGPGGFLNLVGYPVLNRQPGTKKLNPEAALKLWEASEQLTGVKYKSL